jgi:hypothetical protein
VVARNVLAHAKGRQLRKFHFKTIGQLASIGRRTGVANILGINISGFLAWWMWRTIYLSKLPRLEKKLRVALDWTLDLIFSKDLCRSLEVHREKTRRTSASEEAQRQVTYAPDGHAAATTSATHFRKKAVTAETL